MFEPESIFHKIGRPHRGLVVGFKRIGSRDRIGSGECLRFQSKLVRNSLEMFTYRGIFAQVASSDNFLNGLSSAS